MSTGVVVGGGPNGLAAATALAKAGVQVTVLEAADEIGGGTRSGEAVRPGLLHDHCSAFHPMAVSSPFLNNLGLDRYGLEWRWPEIDCVHPLDGGDAAVLHRSVEHTAAGLGVDGARWRRLFSRTSAGFDQLTGDITGPLLRLPKHPLRMARFGLPTLLPGSALARLFITSRPVRCSVGWRHTPSARCITRSPRPSGWASSRLGIATAGRSRPAAHGRSPVRWPRC
jgi:phytoene dehydrogenase-like protein